MPELLRLSDQERREWLRSYQDTYLQRDLADLARLRDHQPFMRFQRLAALRTANLVSFSDLGRDAGTSTETARNYLEYLRISYQAFLLQPYHENLTSAVVKTPKLCWCDIGIARQLSGNWGPLTGHLFETLVVAETMKLIRTLDLGIEAFFYRTRSRMEVDLVLACDGGLACLEIKARDRATRADTRSMRALAEVLGPRFLGGIVVTSGGPIQRIGDDSRFWSVPYYRLMI